MELKLTTKRALDFEERTGKDLIDFLQDISKTEKISLKDMINLFASLGEGYTVEVFDAWDAPFSEKCTKMIEAVSFYIQGNGKN